ncbi:MAG TPA: hypothetical protein VFV10_17225, partial [Gammaproteobacteria bacterium]|nr:hypothetical protein [Gammaproteobacteria bacterium]
MNPRALSRPQPPDRLISMQGLSGPDQFVPSPELRDWIASSYLADGGPLFNPEHAHLRIATLGVLFTTAEYVKQQRRVVGQAEMPARLGGKLSGWQKARA